MIITKSKARMRTEIRVFTGPAEADVQDAFAAYEADKAADVTKTWTVNAKALTYYQKADEGWQFSVLAEASYPEVETDPSQTVPNDLPE